MFKLRGHVNNFFFQKSKKTGSGWVGQVSNWKFKKIGKHIFIHYFITFLDKHSNVNNIINALLCLCSCFYVRYSWMTFEIFRNFFFLIEGWVGGVYRIQTFF